jgi:hypothetical protein
LQGRIDAVHALLSLVSNQSSKTMEAARRENKLQGVQVGHRQGILEFLRMVQRTGAS